MGLKATDAIIVTLDDEGSVVAEKLVQVKIEAQNHKQVLILQNLINFILIILLVLHVSNWIDLIKI